MNLSKLNVVAAIKNKFVSDAAKGAQEWLADLDLDNDGKKDIEEIQELISGIANGIDTAIKSVDAEKVVKLIQAGEDFIAAGTVLVNIGTSMVNTEQAKQGIALLQTTTLNTVAFIKDVAAAQASAKRK